MICYVRGVVGRIREIGEGAAGKAGYRMNMRATASLLRRMCGVCVVHAFAAGLVITAGGVIAAANHAEYTVRADDGRADDVAAADVIPFEFAIDPSPRFEDIEGTERYVGTPEQQRLADELAARVSVDRLMTDLAALPTRRAARGGDVHREGLRETERMLVASLREMGLEPVLHEFTWRSFGRRGPREAGEEGPWNNIIVEFRGTGGPGAGPELPREVLILGAHFDAVPNSPGADDNGTGTAAILEMARHLKDVRHERDIRLCLFNLEEVGLVGAAAYAADVRDEILDGKITVIGMISLDMLGYFRDEPNSQRMPAGVTIPGLELPTVGDFIGIGSTLNGRPFIRSFDEAMRRSAPGLKSFVFDALPFAPPDLLRSDHAPYMAMGIPAAIMSDTANFRSPHYHRPSDTIETIDRERFALVVRGVLGATYELARPVVESGDGSDGVDAAASAGDETETPRIGEPVMR